MRSKRTRTVSILLALTLLCGGLCFQPAAAELSDSATIIAAVAIPDHPWQKKASFPDWKGYTDDTLAMNSMVSFRFWHGQGTLWLEVSDEVESFSLYINGCRFDTSAVGAGAWTVDFSAVAENGVNTLQVSNILPLGLKNAVTAYIPYPTVEEAEDGMEGVRAETLQLISDLIASDVEHGFTSAQLAVVKNGRLVYENAWGKVNSYEPDGTRKTDAPLAATDTLYDLASVTKMFSINYAVQKLVTDKQLDIDTPITEILGDAFAEDTLDRAYKGVENPPDVETQKAWKRALTVKDILRHQAGFPAGPAYYNPKFTMEFTDAEPGVNPCYAVTREETLKAIFKTPLQYEPGTKTVYSDVDYMLLTYVVEKLTGMRLDAYMKETFYAPLGLEHMTFLPLENGFAADDCAATELCGNTRDRSFFFDGVRTETLQGQVHDEKAWYCMDGVSGHAGLFSNAADLARLASVMLTGGYGEHRFFSQDVLDLFTAPKSLDYGQWGLGWWREGDDKRVWYFGTQAPSDTIGHQGWTGTLVMIDPSRELVVAYLTNKINSPIIDPAADSNGFSGKCYTASTLGFVAQILSIGMDTDADISGQLLDLTADMAVGSLNKIPQGADADHPYVMNALSKISVLRKWARSAGSEELLRFADTLASQLPQAPERAFSDVCGGEWFAHGVRFCVENGLMDGVSETVFAPSAPVSRAMLTAILYRLAGSPAVDGKAPFSDVKDEAWYADA
ncbi:MAG: penicillin binding protein PBP4B, partial [Oscillospiraceae bacterium]|nr:penicillin binding protein PBP4B [Oscillospiraceae bacterium]